jgi:serine/threonine-protein kinase RsbW
MESTMGSETIPHALRGSAPHARTHPRAGRSDFRETSADVRLTVPARPENVAVIRHVLGAFAEALRLPADKVEDMRLAVTEACTNVVRHAYHGREPGPIDVAIRPHGDRLDLVVSDRGRGIGPSGEASGPGLGLPLIAALADTVDLRHAPSRGSRLSMSFACHERTGAG